LSACATTTRNNWQGALQTTITAPFFWAVQMVVLQPQTLVGLDLPCTDNFNNTFNKLSVQGSKHSTAYHPSTFNLMDVML
jgi:hypothetical protein